MTRRGGFKRVLGTGEFVRDYLRNGPSYIHKIWRTHKNWCEKMGYTPPAYDSFRSYFWYLKKLNLVERDHEEKTNWGADRIYYRLNPKKLDDSAWVNPRKKILKIF